MKTIFNTDPMPMIPQGCKGEWIWNGYEITSTFRNSISDELCQRKGKWMWMPQVDDSQNAWMEHASITEINEYYKPKTSDTLKAFTLGIVVATAIAIAILLIL